MNEIKTSRVTKISRFKDHCFKVFALFCTFIGLLLLAIFIFRILQEGYQRISWDFFNSFQSRFWEKAGIKAAWMGSIWIFALTALIGTPLGIAAGIYLEEYNPKSRLSRILEINIANLAGVPSVIYGILGMTIFVPILGQSLLAGAITLALLVIPIVIVATRESIKAIPDSIRLAAYGMGASKWQMIWTQLLPASAGGILTGSILALSRIIGETAPIILVGAAASVRVIPKSPLSYYTVLPMQIYDWSTRPIEGFTRNAAAAIIVLLVITFMLNGIAIYWRNKWQKKMKW